MVQSDEPEAYIELSQASTREYFCKNSSWQSCKKNSIVDVHFGSKYISVNIPLHLALLRT